MIYLDHAATTPMRPEVLEAMLPYLTEQFGNPSSVHSYGQQAKLALSRSRDGIARILGCSPSELMFTSGGTESDNTALFGAISAQASLHQVTPMHRDAMSNRRMHIITSQIEHHAILHTCQQLERLGCDITYLPVDEFGQVRLQDVEKAFRPETFMISLMFGNNETGTLQPVYEVGKLAKERNVLMHVDAVQALGAESFQLASSPFDLVSFSSHKINGPKGVGVLYVRKGIALTPQLYGGSQERNKRAGTENIAGIVGFAKAMELAYENLSEKKGNLLKLRELMLRALQDCLDSNEWILNGHPEHFLAHILNISFPGMNTESMLMNLDLEGIAAASGSACSSGSLEPSHVLKAMQLPEPVLKSAVRFSFGFGTTEKDVLTTVNKIATILNKLRNS
jgi:cysteine desulfurase